MDAGVVDEAIRSSRFWCYAQMLHAMHNVPIHLMAWCEGCPCHENLLCSSSFSVRSRKFSKFLLPYKSDCIATSRYECVKACPMAGRRLPEIVENRHIAFLSAKLEECTSDLMQDLQQWQPDQEALSTTLADFEAGKNSLHHTISLKTAFVQHFPYCLAKLASPNEEEGSMLVSSWSILMQNHRRNCTTV